MADQSSASHGASEKATLLEWLRSFLRNRPGVQMRESLQEVIAESERENPALSEQERLMLANLLRFGELRVDDVMVPRADIVAVEEKTTLCDLLAVFREAQHSRLPVYRETLDDPIGIVLLKDVVGLIDIEADGAFRLKNDVPLSKIRRNVLFVPPSMPALDLLLKMQATHNHLALVIDEYGGTDGLVSIEDLVEEIVGDIEDEHDETAQQVRTLEPGVYSADARTDLEDFRALTGIDLNLSGTDEAFDTLGGLVVSLLGRVPQRGEIVAHPAGYLFEVVEADPRRVKRLRIRPVPPQAEPV